MVSGRHTRAGATGSRACREKRLSACVGARPFRPRGTGPAASIAGASRSLNRIRARLVDAQERRLARCCAEEVGVQVMITTDLNLKYRQNLRQRRIACVALSTTSCPRIQRALDSVVRTIDGATAGSYVEVDIP